MTPAPPGAGAAGGRTRGGGAAAGGGGGGEEALRVRSKKRRRLYRSESEPSAPPAGQLFQVKGHRSGDARRPFEARPFPAGTRTIGSYHGAVTNSALHQQQQQPRPAQGCFTVHRDPETHLVRLAPRGAPPNSRQPPLPPPHRAVFSSSGPASAGALQHSYSPAQRGRRRAHSSPVCSPLVVGGESYSLASPSLRLQGEEGGRVPFNGFHLATG